MHAELRNGNNALAAGDRAATAERPRPGCGPCSRCWAWTRWTSQWAAAGRDGDLRGVVDALVRVALSPAAGGPGAQGLPGRRRDQGRPAGRRRAHRGHPAGPALGTEAMSGRGRQRAAARGSGQPGRPRRGHQEGKAPPGHRRVRQAPPGRQGPDSARPPAARPPGAAAGSAAGRPPAQDPTRGGPAARRRCRRRGQRCGPAAAHGDGPEMVAGRNAVLEALQRQVPGTALYVAYRTEHRRPDPRGRQARRRRRAGRARDGPRRTGPADPGRGAPGAGAARPALPVRPPGRPHRAGRRRRPAAADRGARRRHRPAEPRRHRALGWRRSAATAC